MGLCPQVRDFWSYIVNLTKKKNVFRYWAKLNINIKYFIIICVLYSTSGTLGHNTELFQEMPNDSVVVSAFSSGQVQIHRRTMDIELLWHTHNQYTKRERLQSVWLSEFCYFQNLSHSYTTIWRACRHYILHINVKHILTKLTWPQVPMGIRPWAKLQCANGLHISRTADN